MGDNVNIVNALSSLKKQFTDLENSELGVSKKIISQSFKNVWLKIIKEISQSIYRIKSSYNIYFFLK